MKKFVTGVTHKMLGVYIPKEQHKALRIYCIKNEISASALFRDMLNEKFSTRKQEMKVLRKTRASN